MQSKISTLSRLSCLVVVLMLLSVTVGDVHTHRCLDGQEPAVSFHFENLSGHPDHEGDEQDHNDYEYEVPLNTLLVKSLDINFDYSLNSFSTLLYSLTIQQYFIPTPVESFVQKESASFLPLLRAPPVIA